MRVILPLFVAILFLLSSCKKSTSEENKDAGPLTKASLKGFVEKGPFISGSKVQLIELDNQFNATGKIHETTITDDIGSFQFKDLNLISPYVKLSVEGFYFNEVQGKLSDSKITLNAIADIKDLNKLNVNVLSHLETERVLNLVKNDKLTFSNAKKQAETELLAAFKIDVAFTQTFDQIRITDNNIQGNALLTISSILLNNTNYSDENFTKFLSTLTQELGISGSFSEQNKSSLATFTAALTESIIKNIKDNITERYQGLGVAINIDGFEDFIKSQNIGKEDNGNYPPPTNYYTKENLKVAYVAIIEAQAKYLENYYIMDALYAHTKAYTGLYPYLNNIYTNSLSVNDNQILALWQAGYGTVNRINAFLAGAANLNDDESKLYKSLITLIRANTFQSMTELWGDVVYLDKISTSGESQSISRTSLATIKEKSIIAVNAALTGINYGTATIEPTIKDAKAYGEATLIRFYLQQKDYEKVKQLTKGIIDNGNFSLAPRNQLFTNPSAEIISGYTLKPDYNHFKSFNFVTVAKNGEYIPFLRYTEILLAAAEAHVKLHQINDALAYLNQVRTRNGRTAVSGVSNAEAMSLILNEYKLDLGQEGLYFAALKRNELAVQTLGIPAHKNLLPIPSYEMMRNRNMTQNPGYE